VSGGSVSSLSHATALFILSSVKLSISLSEADSQKIKKDATMYQNFIIPYLYEAQHVSGNTPPIIRSLKLHWEPLVFHTWKVVKLLAPEFYIQILAHPVCKMLIIHEPKKVAL
jgi:hypothetical protein